MPTFAPMVHWEAIASGGSPPQTKMLPYGIYVVHQTAGWENTEWMDDFEVNVCENEKDYFYIINDAVLTSHVKIVKKGGEPPLVIVAFCTSCKRQPIFYRSILC